jgi:hypothetical protein
MANFRKGTEEIRKTAVGGGARRFTPNIYWSDGDIRSIVFVTPADEIPKVRLHQAVRIPDDKFERGYRMDNFLCRKDPSMVEASGGECPLCDTIGHDANERFVALAVELEPVKEGKETVGFKVKRNNVKRDDGTEVDYPRWGMVIQGAKNFYSTLAAYDQARGDITKVAFEIHREGGSVTTKYHFFPEKGTPLPEDLADVVAEMPQLETLLEDMGSDEKYDQLEGVEPGSQPKFGDRTETPAAASSERALKFDEIREKATKGRTKVESY